MKIECMLKQNFTTLKVKTMYFLQILFIWYIILKAELMWEKLAEQIKYKKSDSKIACDFIENTGKFPLNIGKFCSLVIVIFCSKKFTKFHQNWMKKTKTFY